MVFPLRVGSAGRREITFGYCNKSFLLEVGSAGQGGRGDSDLPPMPPWTPYTPFKRPRDTPGPPLCRKGHFPLYLDRQGPYRTLHLVWPGASNQSGAAAGTHLAWHRSRGAYCCKVALPWRPHAYTPRTIRRRGAGGGISCAEGDSGPPRDGREPSWARPCEASGALLLSNGGTGGGHAACTLWPPPAPFGYFPARGKYLVRPQADETSPSNKPLPPQKHHPPPTSANKSRAPRIRERGLANKLMETATLTHRKSDKTAPCHPRSPHHAAHHKAPVPGCGFSP